MPLTGFLKALSTAASSPWALLGYVILIAAWLGNSLYGSKLRTISAKLQLLPEPDRLRALELEYRIVPKAGLSPIQYLDMRRRTMKLWAFLATLVFILCLLGFSLTFLVVQNKAKSVQTSIETALELTRIAATDTKDGYTEKAIGFLESALREYPTYQGHINLANIYDDLGDTENAAKHYRGASEMEPTQPSPIINLAMEIESQGSFDEAVNLLSHARELALNKAEKNQYLFLVYGNLGALYSDRADSESDQAKRKMFTDESLSNSEKAIELSDFKSSDDELARAMSNAAKAHSLRGDQSDADKLFLQALEIKRRLAASASLAYTLVSYGEHLVRTAAAGQAGKGQRQRATEAFQEALSNFGATGDRLGLGETRLDLGQLILIGGSTTEARKLCEDALGDLTAAHAASVYVGQANDCAVSAANKANGI